MASRSGSGAGPLDTPTPRPGAARAGREHAKGRNPTESGRPTHGLGSDSAQRDPDRVELPELPEQLLRVLVVDDSRVFLRSLRRLLASLPEIHVVGELTSARNIAVDVDRLIPGLVLMDIAMPGIDGLEATRLLYSRPGAPLIVMMSVHDLPTYREAAHSAGAYAFISKLELSDHLPALIRRVIIETRAR